MRHYERYLYIVRHDDSAANRREIESRPTETKYHAAEPSQGGRGLSTVKKIETGEIKSFDSLLRVMRIFGKLDAIQSLVEEEQLSPNEYYEMMHSAQKKTRKCAVGHFNNNSQEESEW